MSQLIEKKNRQMYFDGANEHQCFGLRKLTIGVASVLLGATLFLGGHTQEAHADTLNTSAPMKNDTSTGEKAASQELSNASQDNVPTNPKVEQAKTPATGTSQSQSASVTSEAQSTNTYSSQASQNKSATLNTDNAHQATQSVNATPTVNSQVKAPVQAHGQVPEANYTPAQASQNKSAALNTYNANKVASQVQSSTVNSNGTNNTQEANNASSISAKVVQTNTHANSVTNTSQNNLASNHTQDYVTNTPVNNKVKINYDALNNANKQANLVLNQPQALHVTNLAMNTQNAVLRLSRNLKDNLNNVDNSKLKLFENNLMVLRNTNPFLINFVNTDDGDDDVNISFPDDETNDNKVDQQTFIHQPGEHYDTKQGVKTVTRNVEWFIIKANGITVPTGHTVIDTINFYEPQAKDDQGHLLPEYSWDHWNKSLDQHFQDRARETEQILSANNNILLDHGDGGDYADISGETLITPTSPNQNIKIYFREGKISTLIRFVDSDSNNGNNDGDQAVLSELSIEGPQGLDINDVNQLNEIKNRLQTYLNQGYKVEDGGNPFSNQIDHHPDADPNAIEPNLVPYRPVDGHPDNTAINIMLDHDVKDFGGDPDTPNPKTGQKDKNTQKTVTRTISYVYNNGSAVMENGQPKKVIQPVTFSRMAHVDMVTGQVTYDDWGTSKSFSAVETPQLAGYTPDPAIVPEKTVDATDPDSSVRVIYKKNAPVRKFVMAQVKYIDDEDNNNVLQINSVKGEVGAPIHYSTQPTIKDFENKGYKLFSDSFGTTPRFFRDDANNYEVHLRHTHKTFGGDQDTPNPKTGQKDKKTQSVVNRIISYVYDNGLPVMDTHNQPSKAKQTWTFARQADVDMVTGKVIYATWDKQVTFLAVTSPAIDGYTPDKAIVPAQTVNATDPDSNVTVTYKQNVPINNDASGQVNYIDDNNNGNVIQTGSFNGKVGDPINYSTQPTIKDLKNKGYKLVSDNFGTTPHTFKDGNNNYEVHFKHSYETVKPGNEKTPGTPINPNDPNGPKWPNGTDKNSVERTGKRTINYTGAYSQTPQPKVDTINFTRQVVVDKVTGQINSATDWQPTSHQFDQVKTPLLDGYTPDKAIVPEQTVNATDPDINITVTYYKKAPSDGGGFVFQKDAIGQVNYIDDNNNGNVIKTGGFNGKVGDPITYSTQPTIKDLQNKGYELVSDNFGTTPHTFKDGNNNYEVHFKHSYETVKPGNEKTPGTPINPNDPNGPKWPNGTDKNSVDRTGKRTINYTGANSQTPQPKVDTTNFTRQVVVDKVTGQITNVTDWQPTSHQFDQVKTPFINYFYADKLYAGNLSVSPSNLAATDLVTYQPMANIIPVDEGHHKIPNVPNPQYTTNPQDPTKATPNQLVPSIQNMVPDQKTVTPINPGQPTEVIYRESKIPTKRKAARLIFKLNDTNTQNITDLRQIQSLPTMLTDGTSGAPMNEKTIPDVYTVNSSGVVSGPDDGDTSKWRAIANANGVNLDAPAKAGYTWKIAKITGTDTSQDIYFVYSKAPDQSSLNVVVHDNTTNQDLPQYGYYHKDAPGTTINYDWPTQKQHLINNGYKIVNEPTVPSTIPDKPQTITITVEHDVAPDNNTDHKHTPGTLINPQEPNGPKWPAKDNFTKDYTYAVNFNDQNGNKVADPQHQVSTWNRTVYVDKVTGEIKPDQSTPWTPDKPNYGNTNVPVVNGYVANKTSKNGSSVSNILPGPKTEQNNTTDTVTYNTVGKIVPVDPNDKPIPGAEQPKYINDPKDPTKVTPNEKVPVLPGKTPRQTSVTPVNPTKDTHIIYDDDAVDTSLKVIVHDQTDNRDLTGYGFNSGTVKSGTRVLYTFNQDRQKLIDHGYEIVNVPAIPTVYGKKPQTVTITVQHAVAPVNNQDYKHTPGTPVNPNDSNGPKWPAKDNYSQDHTYTVSFSGPDGKQVADPKTQTSHWNRTVYVDKVTGEIKPDQSTPWKSDITNYGNTNVPVINGYVANKTSKNGSPVSNILPGPKTEQKDTTDTVTYNTVGKIIPVDSNGKPISGAEQPKYINDPKDPTKVTPNEKVPVLPGKTPRQTSVTPVNPTKDTHIIYDDAAVDTSLKVIVHDQTDNRDLTGYGFNSGTVKSGTRVPYTFNQDHQKLIDRGYEIVNVPEIPTVYGKKPQTVTITVKHAVAPVNNQEHKHTPGTPVNPHDPNGPKWPAKDNYSQDHTYTVSFSGPDGKQLASPKTQTSHWNRTLNIDKVTGQILNSHEPWKSDITNYQDTKVPVINGYVANKTSKNGSHVSKILPGAKVVPSDITDTVKYGKIGRIIPVDSSGKPIPGASTPMYENDPDDPTKVKRTDVPYIKGYTPSVNSVDPKDPTKDTNVVYQKDQPDIVPDNPNENLPSVPNDSNNDLGNFKTPKKKAKKAPAKKAQGPTKQAPVNNNAKQPAHNNNAKQLANNNNAGPATKAKAPVANVAQAATLPNKVVTKQAPANNAKKALPQTGEDQNDLMILAVGSLLGAMSLATLAGTRRKRKHE